MSDKITQAWLEEFGGDSHISLHCYALAYSAGMEGAAKIADEFGDVYGKAIAEAIRKAAAKP